MDAIFWLLLLRSLSKQIFENTYTNLKKNTLPVRGGAKELLPYPMNFVPTKPHALILSVTGSIDTISKHLVKVGSRSKYVD